MIQVRGAWQATILRRLLRRTKHMNVFVCFVRFVSIPR